MNVECTFGNSLASIGCLCGDWLVDRKGSILIRKPVVFSLNVISSLSLSTNRQFYPELIFHMLLEQLVGSPRGLVPGAPTRIL